MLVKPVRAFTSIITGTFIIYFNNLSIYNRILIISKVIKPTTFFSKFQIQNEKKYARNNLNEISFVYRIFKIENGKT